MEKMYWDEARKVLEKVKECNARGPKNVEIIVKTGRRVNSSLAVFDSLNERLDRDVKLLVTSPPYLQTQE
ncbi:MAG: hypothetical protein QXM53_07625 [Thermofilaceae archaeon]